MTGRGRRLATRLGVLLAPWLVVLTPRTAPAQVFDAPGYLSLANECAGYLEAAQHAREQGDEGQVGVFVDLATAPCRDAASRLDDARGANTARERTRLYEQVFEPTVRVVGFLAALDDCRSAHDLMRGLAALVPAPPADQLPTYARLGHAILGCLSSSPESGQTLALTAGLDVWYGGSVETSVLATELGAACEATVEREPTYRFTLVEQLDLSLELTTEGPELLIVVEDENGVTCSESPSPNENPSVNGFLPPGDYRVWIAERYPTGGPVSYGLAIQTTEVGGESPPLPSGPQGPEPTGSTATLANGGPPALFVGNSSGTIDASVRFGADCMGWISDRPSHRLEVTEPLTVWGAIQLKEAERVPLIVLTRGGDVRCLGSASPGGLAVEGEALGLGAWDVWVGSESRADVRYVVTLSSMALPNLDTTASAFARLTMDASSPAQSARGRADGGLPASGIDRACTGLVSPEPDLLLDLRASRDLDIAVTAEGDTTLMVLGGGETRCDDDSNGVNPQISGSFEAGEYRVYVGRWAGETDYRLTIAPMP